MMRINNKLKLRLPNAEFRPPAAREARPFFLVRMSSRATRHRWRRNGAPALMFALARLKTRMTFRACLPPPPPAR